MLRAFRLARFLLRHKQPSTPAPVFYQTDGRAVPCYYSSTTPCNVGYRLASCAFLRSTHCVMRSGKFFVFLQTLGPPK